MCDEDPVEDVLCVRMQAKLYSCRVFDSHLANYEKASHHRLFTDATVTVEDRNFQLHKHVLAAGSPVFDRMFFKRDAGRWAHLSVPSTPFQDPDTTTQLCMHVAVVAMSIQHSAHG